MDSSIQDILLEEIECKKHFEAHWDTDCDVCGGSINEDDDFIFMGVKKKGL